jgi:hypothetical protein
MNRLQFLARQHTACHGADYDVYRDESDSSESSEDDCYEDEEDSEAEDEDEQQSHLSQRRVMLTEPAPQYVPPSRVAEVFNCDDDDPSDWKNSNTKKWIVSELKNTSSDIHLQISEDLKKANYKGELFFHLLIHFAYISSFECSHLLEVC